jgi:hypothetical protein
MTTPSAAPIPRPAEYRYWACDLKTGKKLAQVPLKPNGALPERISDVSTATFTANLGELQPGADFWGSVIEGRTLIVCEREYAGSNASDLIWHGIVTLVDGGNDPEVSVSCMTGIGYLRARHAGAHAYSAAPGETDTKVLNDLLDDAVTDGVPYLRDINCPTLRKVAYTAKERRTILSCLRDLADLDDGPEWTVRASWRSSLRLAVDLTFVARTRLGVASTQPTVKFDFPGAVKSYRDPRDYTEGHGANYLIAINSNGAAGDPAIDTAGITGGAVRWEYVSQKTGALDHDGLTAAGRADLARMAQGEAVLSLAVSLTDGPQLGIDWTLGDDITFEVYNADLDGRPSPSYRHPNGWREVIRVIGHDLDPNSDTLTPVLWNPFLEAS